MSALGGSGSVRATKVQWGMVSGTRREGYGWTCDACLLLLCDDDNQSHQKRKLEVHVTNKKNPCTQQRCAKATRTSVANTGALRSLEPSLSQQVSHQIAMLHARDGWTLTKPPCEQLRETWSKHLEAAQPWVFVCRKAFAPTSAQKWFKDPLNEPKAHPQGPWEIVDGGRAQY